MKIYDGKPVNVFFCGDSVGINSYGFWKFFQHESFYRRMQISQWTLQTNFQLGAVTWFRDYNELRQIALYIRQTTAGLQVVHLENALLIFEPGQRLILSFVRSENKQRGTGKFRQSSWFMCLPIENKLSYCDTPAHQISRQNSILKRGEPNKLYSKIKEKHGQQVTALYINTHQYCNKMFGLTIKATINLIYNKRIIIICNENYSCQRRCIVAIWTCVYY